MCGVRRAIGGSGGKMAQTSVATVTVDETDPRDPTALCDRCGNKGTVVRVQRHEPAPLILRYCGPCWPAASEELEQRQRDEQKRWRNADREWNEMRRHGSPTTSEPPPPPAPWSCASRSWYDARRFIELISQPANGGMAAPPGMLAKIAAEISAKANEMDGPIPPDIQAFITKHLPSSP